MIARHMLACCNASGAQVPVLDLFSGSIFFPVLRGRALPSKACNPCNVCYAVAHIQ